MRRSLTLLVLVASLVGLAACRVPVRNQVEGTHTVSCARCRHERTYHFLKYVPPGYDDPQRATERWPLLVYLPGMISSGTDVRRLPAGDPAELVGWDRDLPMLVVSPMTPTFLERWDPRVVLSLIDRAIREWRADPDRIYITGSSIGGLGAWDVAIAYPDRIAAIVPVAAWGCPAGVERMVDVPVWAFHGALDFAIPRPLHERMIRRLCAAGGHPRWSVIPGGFHWIWHDVYWSDELWTWLLEQRLSNRPGRTAPVRITGR